MSRRAREAAALEGAPVFAALGDATRLRIVARLSAAGPASIAGLTRGAGISRQAITKHLHVLADAGLVRGDRHGRQTSWELLPEKLHDARRSLELISRRWDEALGRLRTFVEK
jgi:DNA-binding transcriptional ArsR family regulator